MLLTDELEDLKINDNIIITKPLIKWLGGKTQQIKTIIDLFPKNIQNYHEPFVGGGSVLLALLSYIEQKNININNDIYAYDLNDALIYMYKNIQNNPIQLYNEIEILKNDFNNCNGNIIIKNAKKIEEAKTSKESYYYWLRQKYNNINQKNTIQASALFIFLNKTCFRGMFRESKNGFNVPYGNYKNPNIINKKHLLEVHKLIKNVKFSISDFKKTFKNINKDDFVYLDPPYIPTNLKSFVNYTKNGFKKEEHELLFNLTKNHNNFIMSNSYTNLIFNYFPKNKYNIKIIKCKRRINSKNPQSNTDEVLIYQKNE